MTQDIIKSLAFITEKLRKAETEEAVKDVLSRLQKILHVSKSTLKRVSEKTPADIKEKLKSSEVIVLNKPFPAGDFFNANAATIMLLPVFKQTELFAFLILETAEERKWGQEEKTVLYACANAIGLAIDAIKLRETDAVFKLLTMHIADAILIVSSGTIIYSNDAATNMLGKIVGKKFLDIVAEESQEAVQSAHARALLDDKSNTEYSFTALKDGHESINCDIQVSIVTLNDQAYGISIVRKLP